MKIKKSWTKIASATLAAALAVSMSPAAPAALAADGDAAEQPAAEQTQELANGLYQTNDYDCTYGMMEMDQADAPAYVNVTDEGATLNIRTYTPNKYGYIYKGSWDSKPATPETDKLIKGVPIVADDDYVANGACKSWIYTDTAGELGAAGQKYKAMYFEIPLTKEELAAGSIDICVPYASWYKNSKGETTRANTWSGSHEYQFTFSNLTPVSTGISTWGTTTLSRRGAVTGYSTYDSEDVANAVEAVDKIPANPTSADIDAYTDAELAYTDLNYNDTNVNNYASSVYIDIAFPEVKKTLEAADKAIPNVVPKDGTYEFLMNQKGSNGWSVDSKSISDRLYNAKLVVKDGKMTLQATQRRGSYSFLATMTPTAAAQAVSAAGLDKPAASVSGIYDYREQKSVYIDHPDEGEAGMYDMYTATFPIESLEKPVIISCYGSSWYNRSFVLSEDNMLTESAAAVARQVNKFLNDPDADDVENTDPAYRVDPSKVSADQADAINAAESAYEQLSADDKASFDGLAVYASNGVSEAGQARLEPYGRVLENAVWGLRAAQATDSATTVANGSYSGSEVTATSSYGKALDKDKTTWTVSKVTVSGGSATATVTSTGDSGYTAVKTNGQSYTNTAAAGADSSFEIPVALDGTTYFAATKDGESQAYSIDVKATPKPAAKTFTVNAATVSASAVKSAATKAGATAKSTTSITLGSKVKKISKGAFKAYKGVKTVTVKTKKLTKKSVKGSLSGSGVKTVKVSVGSKAQNKKYVKAYKKIFTKANAGKKAAVK